MIGALVMTASAAPLTRYLAFPHGVAGRPACAEFDLFATNRIGARAPGSGGAFGERSQISFDLDDQIGIGKLRPIPGVGPNLAAGAAGLIVAGINNSHVGRGFHSGFGSVQALLCVPMN